MTAETPAHGQLEILLEEYRALRAEVVQRMAGAASLIGFLGAGGAFVAAGDRGVTTWIVAVVLGAVLLVVWASYLLAIRGLGRRLRDLETWINAATRTAYGIDANAPLLGWETWLAVDGGWLRRRFRALKFWSKDGRKTTAAPIG